MDGKKTNPVWLIRFDDGGMEECNEKQTRNGIRESSFKPGKKLKVLYEGKWILGILKKVSRTSNALRPYGVKLLGASGRSYNRLYWTPRACIKTLKKENKEPFKLPPESDDFDSDTTPNETSESKKHKGIGLGNGTEEEGEEEGEGHDEEAVVDPLDETKNDGDSDSTSAQDLVEVCFVPGEMVEWKFGVHWVKAKVKKRGESTRKGRSAIYTIQVLDKSAVKILGDEILPAVNERFLRHPRSTDKQDDAARGEGDQQSEEKQADPAEYKKRASPSHALDLVISVGQGSDDAGSADSAEKLHVQKSDEGDFDTDDANAIESSLEKIEYMEEEGPSEVSSGENGGNLEDDETDPEDADANLNTNGVEEQGVMGLGDLVAAAVAPNATKTDIEAGEAGKVGTGEEAEKVGTGEPNSNVSSRNNGEEGNDALDRSGTPNASVSTDVQSEPSGAVGAESKSQTSGDVRREFKETNGGSGNPVVQNDGNDESSVKSSNFEDDQGPKEPISANDITGSEQ
uniref:Uncharacterized protein n=1 Tax=Norrisiella sphaerica TaxID=552664 RepID=A0A7S2VVG0_9EUKA